MYNNVTRGLFCDPKKTKKKLCNYYFIKGGHKSLIFGNGRSPN